MEKVEEVSYNGNLADNLLNCDTTDVPDHISLWGLILPIRKLVLMKIDMSHKNKK
jgi:hypothetical protein